MALHLKAKDQNGIVRGHLTKNRNGSIDLDIAFTIGVHQFGHDDDGDPITSAFAEEISSEALTRTVRLSPTENAVMANFADLASGADEVERSALRDKCLSDAAVSSAEKLANRKDTFNRALKSLAQKRVLEVGTDQVGLVVSGAISDDDFEDLEDEGAEQ
ncbi:hypothetical protein [Pseudaestuariivita rosea]|uniref:hypothetical protein n=1 Tax=Pseudaestuariivita rosea TaxID=2763263 RepID=UPI001ABB3753|nr:hypothetical protein [Pseudaestuariivita rosea]